MPPHPDLFAYFDGPNGSVNHLRRLLRSSGQNRPEEAPNVADHALGQRFVWFDAPLSVLVGIKTQPNKAVFGEFAQVTPCCR